MIKHAAVADAVAEGGTTETSLGTLTVPKSAKKIIGCWCQCVGGDTMTTAEPITGKFRLNSPDVPLEPMAFPLDAISILTSGAIALNPKVFQTDIAVSGGEEITAYLTLDLAQTGTLKARWGLMYG